MSGLSGTARGRSPRFPSHSIGDAVVYAEKIYNGVHRSSIDAQTAFRLMGFAGKSGASATALGSLRQYGLIEGVGDATRVSQLALKILEPVSAQERNEATLEAARKPEVFRAVLNRFDGQVPTADEPVRAFLIREMGFSKGGAEDCLESLRATLDVVRNIGPAVGASGAEKESSQFGSNLVAAESQTREAPAQEVVRIPLTKECSVELRFVGTVTEKGITNLLRHIELMKEVWAEN